MKNIHRHIVVTLIVTVGLTACSKQNWYQGMQSSQTANCMKGPVSKYDDCKQQSDESYENYESNRKDLTKDSSE